MAVNRAPLGSDTVAGGIPCAAVMKSSHLNRLVQGLE